VQNDQRQNRPAPKIRPVDDHADPETAEILQGVLRNIMDNSSADIAIDTAFESATEIGFGYFRVITDYEDPLSFDQEIIVKRIRNQFTVYLDPYAQEPDGSDAKWGFVVEELTKEEFEQSYPKADPVDWETASQGDTGWVSDDSIRVAEYFYIENEDVEIVKLSNGAIVKADQLEEFRDLVPENVTVIDTRTSTVPKVKWCKLTAAEILEENEWAGKYIPIIPVYGEEVELDGEIIRSGMVRPAMDAQRAYNFAASAFIERVALSPKAPFIAAAGQIENYENEWADANTSNIPVLRYDPVTIDGVLAPAPQRQMAADVPQGWLGVMQTSEHDIQASLGMYNTSVGEQGNEISGRAILSKQKKSDAANAHYAQNLGRSIRHLGRIIVDLIPKIYDTKRVLRILGEDGEPQSVQFNPYQEESVRSMTDHEGREVGKIYNPSIGKYDVAITVGASYATKRQEAAEAMLSITSAYPQLMSIAGDLLVKNMDWPEADQLSDRLRRTIPAELLDDDENAIPPQVQAVMKQSADMIEQLQAQNAFLTQQLTDEQDKIQVDRDKNLIGAEANEIKAYDAETKRMKDMSGMMTPQQIQAMILETVRSLSTAPDISPNKGADNLPLDFSGL
jgi:hypothetical protein